jgi:hypothetical protein
LKRKFHPSVLWVRAPWGATNGAEMRDAETYERYASECERIARTMSGEKRQSLLAIAQAWRELAREAKRRSESSELFAAAEKECAIARAKSVPNPRPL